MVKINQERLYPARIVLDRSIEENSISWQLQRSYSNQGFDNIAIFVSLISNYRGKSVFTKLCLCGH